MIDRIGNTIYKGDIVKVFVKNPMSTTTHMEYYYVGRVLEAKNFRTGYGAGGLAIVKQPGTPNFDKIFDTKDRVEKLPQNEAMLWQLENE